MNRQIKLAMMAISLVLFFGWINVAIGNNDVNKKWGEYLGNPKEYKNVLIAGMFTSQADVEKFIKDNPYNPMNGETWDMVYASGLSPNGTPMPIILVPETARVVTDNLSYSLLTDYERLKNIKVEYLVSHSNGVDIAFNVIKYGYVHAEHWVMISPPSGYQSKVKTILESEVKDIKIFHTEGDKVVSTLGKNLLPGLSPLGKWFDVRLGLDRNANEFFWGARVDIPLGEGKRLNPSSIQEFQFKKKEGGDLYFKRSDDNDIYFTNYPHALKWEFNNIVLFNLNSLDKAYNRNPVESSKARIEQEMLDFCNKFPEAKNKFFENWSMSVEPRSLPPRVMELIPSLPSQRQREEKPLTDISNRTSPENIANYWTYGGRPQSMTEVEMMSAFAHNKERALVVGEGKEAKYLFQQLEKTMGPDRVRWVKDEANWRQEAGNFKADVVLGVKSYASLPPPFSLPPKKDDDDDWYRKMSPNGPPNWPPPPPLPSPGAVGRGSTKNSAHNGPPSEGGVTINPNPKSSGKGGAENKKKILESRPQGDSSSWETK